MTCSFCRYQWCWLCDAEFTKYHYSSWNLIGCPGQRITEIKPSCLARCSNRVLHLLGLLIAFILGIAILLPSAIILWFPIWFNNIMHEDCKNTLKAKNKCGRCLLYVGIFFISIFLNVLAIPLTIIALVLGVILSPVMGCCALKGYC